MSSTNSIIRAWLLAARPQTLPASLSPVLVGCALARHDGFFQWTPSVLCLLVALFAQIASNFANDYFDYINGADGTDRLGPKRAVAEGWIAPVQMLRATIGTLSLACLCGCGLLFFQGPELILVGMAIAVGAIAYSAGPYPLAYHGLGDACVLVFYGLVPVNFTYYVLSGGFSLLGFLLSVAVGVLSINILIVNNYRDYRQDRDAGKNTTIVIFGRRFGRIMYMFNGVIALFIILPLLFSATLPYHVLFALYFILFMKTWLDLVLLNGRALNKVLAATAINVLLFSLLISAFLIL